MNAAEWEHVCTEDREFESRITSCMRIEEGTLYRCEIDRPVSNESRQFCVAMVFVPDRPRPKVKKVRRVPITSGE